MKKYKADLDDLTVYMTDHHGEVFDLNAGGERLANTGELLGFIDTLQEQGAYDCDTRNKLAASVMADRVWASGEGSRSHE